MNALRWLDPTPAATSAAQAFWQQPSALLLQLDSADRVLAANPAAQGLLGTSPAKLAGRPFTALLQPGEAAYVTAALALTRKNGLHHIAAHGRHAAGHSVDLEWTLAGGTTGTVLATGRPLAGGAGAPSSGGRLNRLVAMSRLAGGIAHDFNNLLAALRNALELVRRQPHDAAAVQRWAESALRVLDHGARLTARLLASSAAQRLALRPVAVVPLLHGLRDAVARTVGTGVTLQLALADDAGSVLTDPAQLEAAVLSLAANACDALHLRHDGSGTLVLGCQRQLLAGDSELPSGEYVRIILADNGSGMTSAVRERAFEPFFTTKPMGQGQGTGLGLSQVHGFTRQCGGSTRVDVSGAAGTTVSMLLPVLAASVPAEAPPPAGDSNAGVPVAVVVAGTAEQRRRLCDSLRLLGWRAVPAASGSAAVAALRRHAAQVLVLGPGVADATQHAAAARRALPGVGVVQAAAAPEQASELEALAGLLDAAGR